MNTAFVVIRASPHLPPAVRQALARRRHATLTGRCACGGVTGLAEDKGGYVTIAHESDCPAGDDEIMVLLRYHGVSLAQLEQEVVLAETVTRG